MSLGMLKNNRFMGARVEAAEGVGETMTYSETGTHDGRLWFGNARINWNPTQTPRDVHRPSFEPLPPVVGGNTIGLNFNMELAAASGGAATEPQWSKILRACGYGRRPLKVLTPSTITNGPFEHGEEIVQATSAAQGIVFGRTANGSTTLYVMQLGSAAFNTANVITGQRSGATCTPSAVGGSVAQQGWTPATFPTMELTISAQSNTAPVGTIITGGTSGAKGEVLYANIRATTVTVLVRLLSGVFVAETLNWVNGSASTATCSAAVYGDVPSLTMELYLDGQYIKARGCRGNVEFGLNANQQAIMSFAMQGVYDSGTLGTTDVADAQNPSCKDYLLATPPPVFRAGTLLLDTVSTALKFNSLRLSPNNNVVVRASAMDVEGFAAAQILSRKSSMSFNPDAVPQGTVPWWTKLRAGTTFRFNSSMGTSPSKFGFIVDEAFIESIGDGERDPIYAHEINALCSSGVFGSGTLREGRDNGILLLNT